MIVDTAAVAKLRKAGVDSTCMLHLLMELDSSKNPHTLVTLAKACASPLSTVSRHVYELSEMKLLRYGTVVGDRRKKILLIERKAFDKIFDGKK